MVPVACAVLAEVALHHDQARHVVGLVMDFCSRDCKAAGPVNALFH